MSGRTVGDDASPWDGRAAAEGAHPVGTSTYEFAVSRLTVDAASGRADLAINARGVPRAGLALLDDVARARDAIHALNAGLELHPRQPVRFVVLSSALGGVFGLGGDLALLADLVEGRDGPGLAAYARAAAMACFEFADGFGSTVVTVALVQGTALGGMFEAARSCDVLVAEPQASFGLPEAEFGLFPGAGAIASLVNRIGARALVAMMSDGRALGAREAHAAGIVDVMAEAGGGAAAVEAAVARMGRRFLNAHAVHRGVARSCGMTRERYLGEGDSWARHALHCGAHEVARMRRLAGIQDRKYRSRA